MASESESTESKSVLQKVISGILVVVVIAVIVGWRARRPIMRYFRNGDDTQQQDTATTANP